MIGVDSALNCSGAQNGALDPLNDMFWTWNNGYTMFKLEGKSDSSKADNNRIEHHIGGYKGEYKTMQNIFLPLDENYFTKKNSITIIMNLDNYWTNNIKISENPIVATPGKMAKLVAENFVKLFSIQK
ncbi:MAG: MbnP family protein [Ferruginibacter sp.]